MGNALRFLCNGCSGDAETPQPLGSDGVAVATLAHDLFNFDINSQVPNGLSNLVQSSKKVQANWYRAIVVAWRESKPPPKTAEEAARLIIKTLKRIQMTEIEGFLDFYNLPLPDTLLEHSDEFPTALPEGVKFEFQTLPVDPRAVQDGDKVVVYVNTADPRESSLVPPQVNLDAAKRLRARHKNNHKKADELYHKIVSAGYNILKIDGEDVLARRYQIRMRGIDAPALKMPYGDEAKEVLTNLIQGKCLRVMIYGDDRFGRSVGDIYCNGIFIQEILLRNGHAWHYANFDKRPAFARWEREARAKRIGLWALPNPEKPWEWRWRRNQRANK